MWHTATDRSSTHVTSGASRSTSYARNQVPELPYGSSQRYGALVDLAYCRVSTAKQDLDRQIDAARQVGIPPERIYVDKKSGATVDRPALRAALDYARAGDVLVVHTLDRLGRTVRDTLNLIHELSERGIGVRKPRRPDPASTPASPTIRWPNWPSCCWTWKPCWPCTPYASATSQFAYGVGCRTGTVVGPGER